MASSRADNGRKLRLGPALIGTSSELDLFPTVVNVSEMDCLTLERRRKARALTPFQCEVQVTLPSDQASLLASYHLSHPRLEPEIRTVNTRIPRKRHGTSKGRRRKSSFEEVSRSQLRAENEELKMKVLSLGQELRRARETILQMQSALSLSSASTTCSDPPRALRTVPVLNVKALGQGKGFQEEFMENFPNFSQSWRAQIP